MSDYPWLSAGFTYTPESGALRLEVLFTYNGTVYDRIVEVEGSTVDDRIIEDSAATDRIIEVNYG